MKRPAAALQERIVEPARPSVVSADGKSLRRSVRIAKAAAESRAAEDTESDEEGRPRGRRRQSKQKSPRAPKVKTSPLFQKSTNTKQGGKQQAAADPRLQGSPTMSKNSARSDAPRSELPRQLPRDVEVVIMEARSEARIAKSE